MLPPVDGEVGGGGGGGQGVVSQGLGRAAGGDGGAGHAEELDPGLAPLFSHPSGQSPGSPLTLILSSVVKNLSNIYNLE